MSNSSSDRDALRWRFAIENNCFPTIAGDGERWVVWGRNIDWKLPACIGSSPDEAIDDAMRRFEERAQCAS